MPSKNQSNGCLILLIQWLIGAGVIYLTAWLLPGIHIEDGFIGAIIVAIVLSILNTFVRPILIFLTLPATIITLGLFVLVINAVILMLAGWLLSTFHVDSFWWALLGAVIIAILHALIAGMLTPPPKA